MAQHLEVISGPAVTQSGTLAVGSAAVTGLDTAALAGAVAVTGAGIPPGTYVLAVDSPGQVTLTAAATADGASDLTFALEPITLAEAKKHIRLEIPDDDDVVAAFISAARIRAQGLLRSTLLVTTYDWYLDYFPTGAPAASSTGGPIPPWLVNAAAVLTLPNPPLVAVASVKYLDSSGTLTTIDPATYAVSPGYGSRIQPIIGHIWPVARPQLDAVVIRYTAGVATADDIPANVKAAVKLIVGHLYEHREEVGDMQTYPVSKTVEDLLASTDPGVYS